MFTLFFAKNKKGKNLCGNLFISLFVMVYILMIYDKVLSSHAKWRRWFLSLWSGANFVLTNINLLWSRKHSNIIPSISCACVSKAIYFVPFFFRCFFLKDGTLISCWETRRLRKREFREKLCKESEKFVRKTVSNLLWFMFPFPILLQMQTVALSRNNETF